MSLHVPVLLAEVLQLLSSAESVLDCTLGDGGHTLALLEQGATVTAIDQDPGAIRRASDRLQAHLNSGRLEILQGNFADPETLRLTGDARYGGILVDLGVSSWQIDEDQRGFTFRAGAVLDMRMNPAAGQTAADLLNSAAVPALEQIFRENADEPRAARLAGEVSRRRRNRAFQTSDDLVGAIRAVLGPRSGSSDFARIFQGVRIAVNNEFDALESALPALRDRLAPGGVIAVIAYHSGEDRRVKNAFRDWSIDCICPPLQPRCTCDARAPGRLITRRAIKASEAEITSNPRARSARLRAWQKTS